MGEERKKMDGLQDVYNDLIMEHSMNSYNKKKLETCDLCGMEHNPNCGDEIAMGHHKKIRQMVL